MHDRSLLSDDREVQILARRLEQFWHEEASGGVLTGNLLTAADHQVREICRAQGVKMAGVLRAVRIFAHVGAALIMELKEES